MANGMRDNSKTPLTAEEIEYVKKEIEAIDADINVFIFNDDKHIEGSTCYNFVMDKVFVTRNVFPDTKYGSTHPRDLMSVRAVLAHEYYGHRTFREEYISDAEKGAEYHTMEYWQDECRASISAAKLAPNLSERDRSNLILDAVYRAKECGYCIEMDDFMKETVYGYSSKERNIILSPINYVSRTSAEGICENGKNDNNLSKMQKKSNRNIDRER